MKTTLHLALVLLCSVLSEQLLAQNLPNQNFNDVADTECAYDSSQLIFQYTDWLIYQTLDDEWDGPVDSTKCIGVLPYGNSYRIDLDEIDPLKPVFLKCLLNDDNKIFLTKDWLFNVQAFVNFPENAPVDLSGNCANGVCSGILVGVEVPDEFGIGTNLRVHPVSFTDFGDCDANVCLPTERFEENYLREFVYKFTFTSTDLEGVNIIPDVSIIDMVYEFGYVVDTVKAYPWQYNQNDMTYFLSAPDLALGYESVLLLYRDATYPSFDDVSYTDVTLLENEPEPQNIHLTIDEWSSFSMQPFTSLRGGLVAGSDSVRHYFNLENNGGNSCFAFIEVSFGNEESFTYSGGQVNFTSQSSCLQFMHGGRLVVADNSTFVYGDQGAGILALRQGGTIELGHNSTLILDNLVNMFEVRTDEPQQIYMTLNAGSTLIFGERARLMNDFSIDKAMKLNVYMNGGVLDDRNLSAKERALINRIYPEEPLPDEDLSFLAPNPAASYSYWTIHSPTEEVAELHLYNANGQLISYEKEPLTIGPNQVTLDLRTVDSGIYYLHWQTGEQKGVKKLVKI